MKEIYLTRGLVTLVDDEDYTNLNYHKWYALSADGNRFYVAHDFNRKCTLMHRLIMKASNEIEVDHIDLDSLNNQKYNLRVCSSQQNKANMKSYASYGLQHTSQYKGVSWDKARGKWQVGIHFNDRRIAIGRFDDEMEAAQAYDQKAIELFGEFAYVNFRKE